MTSRQFSRRQLAGKAAGRLVAGVVVLAAMFFVTAGTVAYWQAWVYLCVLFVPMTLVLLYLLVHDPELLERRMRMKEQRTEHALIVKLGSICYLLAFLVPGLDQRFGLSSVPVAAVVTADVLVLLGYGLFVLVLRENSYASRVVEVEEGQRVITTGPYAVVRHPMYVAALVTFSFTPVALGSWWALIPVAPLVAVMVARIRHEERLLMKELEGYQEYTEITRYRLIPGVW